MFVGEQKYVSINESNRKVNFFFFVLNKCQNWKEKKTWRRLTEYIRKINVKAIT